MSAQSALDWFLDGYTPSIVLAIAAVLLLCWQKMSVKLDPQEPPLLKPKLPYIGHIIGLISDQMEYFDKIYSRCSEPAMTLPMLNGKLYIVQSPALIASSYRNKNLSFDPFMVEFSQALLGMTDKGMIPIKDPGDGEKKPSFVSYMVGVIHKSMMGEHLYKMNASVLNNVAIVLNEIEGSLEPSSFYLWARDMLSLATCNSLLGSHSPFIENPGLLEDLWDFEAGMIKLVFFPYPSLTAPKAFRARAKLQAALIKYYDAHHDEESDVSEITRARAAVYREYSMPSSDIGKFELALLQVSTANAIPTFFWLLCAICSSPSLFSRIRSELSSIITLSPSSASPGNRECRIDITKFETKCPLLVSCYKEVQRLANAQTGNRRVMNDTTLSDGKNTYLLKKGTDIQMPSGGSHLSTEVWGEDAASFNAERFLYLNTEEARTKEGKDKSRCFIPFGGGKHLCPGRNFAFAEILGTVAGLVLGFEVKGEDGGILEMPKIERCKLGTAVTKPVGRGLEMGARIERRKGWEDVMFRYIVGGVEEGEKK